MSKSGFTIYAYDACDTCRKARKWLDAHGIAHEVVPIVEKPPSRAMLSKLVKASGLPAHKWFNTSGQSYRALVASLGKPKVAALGEDEVLELLAKDGKLIKRPVLVAGDKVLVGFRPEQYDDLKG